MEFGKGSGWAITIAISIMLMYDVMSTTNSSPQTTEINAKERADTLMKWVKLGLLQGGGLIVLIAIVDDDHWPPLLGGGIAGALLWAQYVHAKNSGLESSEPGTETHANGS